MNSAEPSNTCTIEDILKAEARATQLVAIIAVRIEEGPKVFSQVMQGNLDRGVNYRYLLLRSGEVSLAKRFKAFQDTLHQVYPGSFQGKLIDYEYVESDVTIIDPVLSTRRGFILGDDSVPNSRHLEIRGKNLFRLCDRFTYLWQIGEELD